MVLCHCGHSNLLRSFVLQEGVVLFRPWVNTGGKKVVCSLDMLGAIIEVDLLHSVDLAVNGTSSF